MPETFPWIIPFGLLLAIGVLGWILFRILQDARKGLQDELRRGREEHQKTSQGLREELTAGLQSANTTITSTLKDMGTFQQNQLDGLATQLKALTDSNQERLDRIRDTVDSCVRTLQESNEKKLDAMRTTVEKTSQELREALTDGMKSANTTITSTLKDMGTFQQNQLDGLTKQLKTLTDSNQERLDRIRDTVDSRVRTLQESNEKKLDAMRTTVDEKLQDTLEKRLGESFNIVSERLTAVHEGLGEMQNLATGVGDLKRVLTNVSTRGAWAEVQLGAILEQVLAPTQFEKNVQVKTNTRERVEYAVRLPGAGGNRDTCVWLPIDAKFPQEDYLRLQKAAERADPKAVGVEANALARTVRDAARDIHNKYIHPPDTTDFGIMFLATEGLYAEALRHPNLVQELQQKYRVVVAGPTTLAAILSSLRMGFQTLAIEQRATEVWKVLGAVKAEFKQFGAVIKKVQDHLQNATQTIEKTDVSRRAMERSLDTVEQLSDTKAAAILALSEADEGADSAETASNMPAGA